MADKQVRAQYTKEFKLEAVRQVNNGWQTQPASIARLGAASLHS